MKAIRNVIIGLVVLVVLLATTVTYSVRFNESAVLTTFGRADESSVINEDGTEAGLHFKWPWPVQDVARTYPKGLLVLDGGIEQASTRDRNALVVETYVGWRVSDPLRFYTALSTTQAAEQRLRSRLRAARAVLGEYDFDQLIGPGTLETRGEIETRMRDMLAADLADEGIEIETVGLQRVGLTEDVSRAVLERMRKTNEQVANAAVTQGDAQAAQIRSKATQDERRIQAFVELRAAELRAQGDRQAGAMMGEFNEAPELARFIIQINMIPQMFGENVTLLLDPADAPPVFGDTLDPLRDLAGTPSSEEATDGE